MRKYGRKEKCEQCTQETEKEVEQQGKTSRK